MTEQHKLRCETCDKGEDCPLRISMTGLSWAEKIFLQVGCASHSNVREVVNEDVIKELERLTIDANNTGEPVFRTISVSYQTSIKLIKEGVPK